MYEREKRAVLQLVEDILFHVWLQEPEGIHSSFSGTDSEDNGFPPIGPAYKYEVCMIHV